MNGSIAGMTTTTTHVPQTGQGGPAIVQAVQQPPAYRPGPPQRPNPPARRRGVLSRIGAFLHSGGFTGALFYGGVLTFALIGSATAAVTWLGWDIAFALPAVALLEVGGVYLADMADRRRQLGESALAARLLSAAVAVGAVALNYFGHLHTNVYQAWFFAGLSALGYGVWLVRSGQRRRDKLRADGKLPAATPAFGLGRWLTAFPSTWQASQVAKEHPELGLYGSLEVIRLRKEVEPYLFKLLAAKSSPEEARMLMSIMKAKGMVDMISEMVDFHAIAAGAAAGINTLHRRPPAPPPARATTSAATSGRAGKRGGVVTVDTKQRRSTAESLAMYDDLVAQQPGLTQLQYARMLGFSDDRRLRQVLETRKTTTT